MESHTRFQEGLLGFYAKAADRVPAPRSFILASVALVLQGVCQKGQEKTGLGTYRRKIETLAMGLGRSKRMVVSNRDRRAVSRSWSTSTK